MPDSSSNVRTRGGRAFPNWGDLSGSSAAPPPAREVPLSTPRFVLLVLAVAGACALYVGHVHATQALFTQVEDARAERQRLQLKKNRLQSAFEEATAPAVIHRRAEALGLEEGLARGPVIRRTRPETHAPSGFSRLLP